MTKFACKTAETQSAACVGRVPGTDLRRMEERLSSTTRDRSRNPSPGRLVHTRGSRTTHPARPLDCLARPYGTGYIEMSIEGLRSSTALRTCKL